MFYLMYGWETYLNSYLYSFQFSKRKKYFYVVRCPKQTIWNFKFGVIKIASSSRTSNTSLKINDNKTQKIKIQIDLFYIYRFFVYIIGSFDLLALQRLLNDLETSIPQRSALLACATEEVWCQAAGTPVSNGSA